MSRKQHEATKVMVANSDRVKTVEIHPKEPLVICSLYSGQVTLWNYDTQSLVKSFEITDLPVRCVKFIVRLQSFACGSDDMLVRVYNYNTMEKTAHFEAHQDYIRAIAIHDQLPYLLTASDDMTVKMFDWTKGWSCVMVFEGHTHYVMAVTFNPKDPSTFATASLDETIMVWNVSTPVRNFCLEGHEQGVNCVEYFPGGDKPYLLSGSDDNTVKVWDYQTKACLQTLQAHNHYVTCVAFHPDLPLIITGSEDENLCTFSTQTWRNESTECYNLGRAWSISMKAKCNKVAIGTDKGLLVLKLGKEDPTMSMDGNGKILFAQTNEIVRLDIKNCVDKDVADGDLIQLPAKELGTCEGMPRKMLHSPNGQYVAVLMDDDEYIVHSSLGWRSTCFGRALSFVWAEERGCFAILENSYTLTIFKAFKQKQSIKLEGTADMLFAGPVIGVRLDGNVVFYDWEDLRVVRQITETPNEVVWSSSGELAALVTDSSTFVLKYNAEAVAEAFASGQTIAEDGVETAFDLVEEVEEKMRRAVWVGDCLLFVNRADRIMYYIGGEMTSLAVMPRSYSLLGYVAKENRVYCMDNDRNVVAYQLYTSVIDFKTAVVREDFDAAREELPKIPESMKQKVAEFLQARNHLRMAMEITTDEDHRFDLAVQLGDLSVALGIARDKPSAGKWKLVGDIALAQAHFDVAQGALRNAKDYNGLLLLFTSLGDMNAVRQLSVEALAQGRSNVAFTCMQLLHDYDGCIDLLCQTGRLAEAAFYARTYRQSRICEVVDKWRTQLANMPRLRDSIADPVAYPNLFPEVAAADEADEEADAAVEAAAEEQAADAAAEAEAEEEEDAEEEEAAPPAAASPVAATPSPDKSAPTSPARSASDAERTPAKDVAETPAPVAPPPSMVKPPAEASPAPAEEPAQVPKAASGADMFEDDEDDWGAVDTSDAKPAATGAAHVDPGADIDDIFDDE